MAALKSLDSRDLSISTSAVPLVIFLLVATGDIMPTVLSKLRVSCSVTFTCFLPHVKQYEKYLMYSLRNCSVNSP